ncbi:MAG: serine/threonine protein kinase [Polyangiaceae bacterium]
MSKVVPNRPVPSRIHAVCRRVVPSLLALLVASGTVACGRPFQVVTPSGFLELEDQEPDYAYRATTPDGVTVGVKVIALPEEHRDLAFWTKAVSKRVREGMGYAFLEEVDVKSKDGTPGKELRFAHDEGEKPFFYAVTLYIAQERLFTVESGGPKEAMLAAHAQVESIERSIQVRCGSAVAPVLASRTCNRW